MTINDYRRKRKFVWMYTPAYAGLPGPENVLIVYKKPIDENDTLGLISQVIKDYYQQSRGIPHQI